MALDPADKKVALRAINYGLYVLTAAEAVARGDHTVFVAEVVSAGVRDSAKVPLVLRSTGLNYGG